VLDPPPDVTHPRVRRGAWPYGRAVSDARPQPSIASTFVLGGLEPLRLVIHHADGSWDFLCNTTDDARFLVTVEADHVFTQFPADLAALRTLPSGSLAEREDPSSDWSVEPYDDE